MIGGQQRRQCDRLPLDGIAATSEFLNYILKYRNIKKVKQIKSEVCNTYN